MREYITSEREASCVSIECNVIAEILNREQTLRIEGGGSVSGWVGWEWFNSQKENDGKAVLLTVCC